MPAAGRVLLAPAWSADGGRVALVVGDAPAGLLILDRVTLASYRVAGAVPCLACPPPRWSFDGTAVAFAGSAGGNSGLFTYRPLAQATDAVQQAATAAPVDFAWAADGSQLYTVTGAGIAAVASHPIAGATTPAPLAGARAGDAQIAVPAYDRRLAFVRTVNGVPQLWLMNSDGSGQRNLTAAGYDFAERLTDFGVALPAGPPPAHEPAGLPRPRRGWLCSQHEATRRRPDAPRGGGLHGAG